MKTTMKLGFGLLAMFSAACSAGTADDTSVGDDSAELRAKKPVIRVERADLVTNATDSNLVNAWGMAFNPKGPVWISNNASGTSTVYDDTGKLLLTVNVPDVAGSTEKGAPTGQVFNASPSAFKGDKFIFANEHGSISGWQPAADVVTRFDQSSNGAVYKGLAIAAEHIFAADFHNGRVDTFDANYALVSQTGFVDPKMPSGFAPFNIQTLDGKVYVAFAKQQKGSDDEKAGAGKGYVSVFDTDGNFTARVASAGVLNAPWGLAIAPPSFGAQAGKLLVGNFGDGKINVFELAAPAVDDGYGSTTPQKLAKYVGPLGDSTGKALVIEGLWGLAVSPSGTLRFTAGPADESGGAYGNIVPK